MNKTVLALLLFLIVPLIASAENNAPEIISFYEASNDYDKYEGELFEFKLNAADPDNDELAFEWDFGDGSEIAITESPEVMHNYYFDAKPGEKTRSFTVTVKASDGLSETEASVEIEVTKSSWKARLRSPLPHPSEMLSKQEEIYFEIEVLSYSNSVLSVGNISAKAELAGREIELKKERDFFYGTLTSDYSFNNIELFELEIKKGSKKSKQKFPLFFSPEEITIEGNPLGGKSLYLGSGLGKVRAKLVFRDGSTPESSEFEAVLYLGNKIRAQKKMEKEQDYFTAEMDYAFTPEDFFEEPWLKISGSDTHGNVLDEKSFRVQLKEDNPQFNLRLETPNLAESNTFGYGQKVKFVAGFDSNEALENVKVNLLLPEQKIEKELLRKGNEFSTELLMPAIGPDSIPVAIYGTARVNGADVSDIEVFELNLTKELKVSFVYPAPGETTIKGNGKTIIVSVNYPNNEPFEKKTLKAMLYLDGKKQIVSIKKDEQNSHYSIELDEVLVGEHSLKLVIPETGTMAGSVEIHTNITQPFDWTGLLLLATVIALLAFAFFYINSRLKKTKAEFKEPRSKQDYIKSEMKKLELDFYKRKISEDEFKERMIRLQREAKKAEARVKQAREQKGPMEIRLPTKKPKAMEEKPTETIKPRPSEGKAGAGAEERLTEIIEKRLKTEEGLHPLIIGRGVEIKKEKPLKEKIEFKKPEEKITPEKPRETISMKKIEGVKETLSYLSPKGKAEKSALSMEEEEAVKKLVLALKPKASAFTRDEIFNSIISEGFSQTIAREAVKRIFE